MNVLVIGAGGREHALAYKLNQSNLVKQVFVIPGNEAMTPIAEVHTEISESDHQGILDFAKQQNVDWVVIGPEQPLIDGLADIYERMVSKCLVQISKQLKSKAQSYLLKR